MSIVWAANNFGDTRTGGLAGPMGLFIIVMMSVAVVLLIRNMNKRLRRLPDSFPDHEADRRAAEIARLDADLAAPDARPDRPHIDGDGSTSPPAAGESEVSDARRPDRPAAEES